MHKFKLWPPDALIANAPARDKKFITTAHEEYETFIDEQYKDDDLTHNRARHQIIKHQF